MNDAEIEKVMSDGEDLQTIARKLIDTALDQGSRDNVTALVVRYEAER